MRGVWRSPPGAAMITTPLSIVVRTVARSLRGRHRGMETIVAVGILGAIAVSFMTGLSTLATSTDIADEHVTAENLARVQLEYIRSLNYFTPPSIPYSIPPGNAPGAYTVPPPGITPPSGYSIVVEVNEYCDGATCYPVNQLQKVTAKVYRDGEQITVISDLKTNR